MRRPDRGDLKWAAGFLEGEGTFRLNPAKYPSERVTGTQVQLWPLKQLQEMFGGTIRPKDSKPPRQQAFVWYVSGSRARGVMLTLFTLMSPRRKAQIRKALRNG